MKKMSKKAYDRGGSVRIPQAPEEPDQRIDKMTGLPYDQQAGGAFVDEEDRLKFVAGGLRTIIQRLARGVDDVVTDTRPVTRLDADDGAKETLRDLRYKEPENFIDPNSPDYSITKVKLDDEKKFIKYLDEEESLTLNDFNNLSISEKDDLVDIFNLSDPNLKIKDITNYQRRNVEYVTQPDNRYWKARTESETKISKELDDELNNIPEEDMGLVKKYTDDIPRVSDKPPESATVTKQEFLEGSTEKSPQYNGSFFSETRYDNPLSSAVPRELGFHVGTKGQAENIMMRGTHPNAETIIEEAAVSYYKAADDLILRDEALDLVGKKGVPDEIYDSLAKELNEIVPIGVEPKLQKGFINVKNPLVLDTDFINWNPSKFLGGSDLTGNLKLAEQADDFIKALDDQVNLPEAQFTKIVDDAAGQINSIVRKKDMNSGKLLNSAYDHEINRITKTMLEDLGFDSIKYKNLGELARASEKKAGGNSYILFREDQFKTSFKQADDVKKLVDKGGKPLVLYRGSIGYGEKGIPEAAMLGEPRQGYATFASTSPHVAASYGTPIEIGAKQMRDDMTGAIIPLHVYAKKGIEFPVRVDRDGYRSFSKTGFDQAAKELPADTVLVARQVYDRGPRASEIIDPEKLYSYPSDIYAWGSGTKTAPALSGPSTVSPFKSVPRPATYDQMYDALDVKKKEKINIKIPDGQKVGLRLDIHAYERHDTWVPTVHDEGGTKRTSHRATAAISDVDLSMSDALQRKAEKIKGGKAKSPFARIGGRLINRTDEENYRLAQEYLDDPEWTQVGYNPDKHSYFFDRSSPSRPVVAGEEALQVGPLVLVKNAKFGNQADFRYATGGKVLGGLKRTRRAEGGGFFKSIENWISKKAKELGFDDRRQLGISADATKITNRMVESGQLPETNRITWGVQQEGEADRIVSPDELPEAGSRAKIGFVPNPDGSMQDEQPFDTINHALFGYESAESQKAKWGGQLKEVYQGIQEAAKGRNWRTEYKDMWNNQWGINQRQKGLTREEFDEEVTKAILESQRKLEAGEALRIGKDLIISPQTFSGQ